jgi:antitoxin (DNA-binding transcriptional repressor) of toxin-antitoxin stability system
MTHVDVQRDGEIFPELMELVASGKEIIIDEDKQPFAKLLPVAHTKKQRQGMIVMAEDFDEPLEDWLQPRQHA